MNFKQTAIALALLSATGVASAANVESITLADSDFAFFLTPNGANLFSTDVAPIQTGVEMAAGSFSTGFNFGGTGDFVPYIANDAGTGSITADITGGALTYTALDFGGTYQGSAFNLAPADVTAVASTVVDNGDGTFGFVSTFSSTITTPGSFLGYVANWRLVGTMDTNPPSAVPVPAAVWLFGSGLIGLAGVARRRKTAA